MEHQMKTEDRGSRIEDRKTLPFRSSILDPRSSARWAASVPTPLDRRTSNCPASYRCMIRVEPLTNTSPSARPALQILPVVQSGQAVRPGCEAGFERGGVDGAPKSG